jgi:hypothetical protein
MTMMRWLVLAAVPFVLAACDAAVDPLGSYAAALCNPGCASDNDCPTADSCTIRRCDTSSGSCYTAGVRASGTLCNQTHWCTSNGTCDGLREGEVCVANQDCASHNCLGGICRGDTAQGSRCIKDADCVNGDTCLGTWKCVGVFAKTCRIDFTTPKPAGALCTFLRVPGTCVADPSGRTHCLFPNGTSVFGADLCQSGYNLNATDGVNRCSALPECAPCTKLNVSGADCAPVAEASTCGATDCQCGDRNDYRCSQGACRATVGTCPGHYACSGNLCGATCNSDAECDSHTRCNTDAHTCLLRLGQTCGAAQECYSGYCVAGACGCASTGECPANDTCDANTHTCLHNNGQVCTSPSQCLSGFCIPGIGGVNRCSALERCHAKKKVIDLNGRICVRPGGVDHGEGEGEGDGDDD